MKPFFIVLSIFFFINTGISQPTLTLTQIPSLTGLNSPMQLVNAGDGTNRIFIVEKDGDILVYDKSYGFLDTFLIRSGLTIDGEQGLLSIVFHPSYASNGFFYIYYDNADGNLELSRYHVSANPNKADQNSGVILKTIMHQPNENHNGGELHFGYDGYLYLSTGDGGSGGDPPNNAQTTSVLLGKILRFDVNTTNVSPYYTIPAGNPFGNEVYCYGLRNPFRWSFDRVTNDMWIGDVGQDSYEEFNFRPWDSTKGVNFGWRCYEGNDPYNTSTGCAGPSTNYNFPVFTYPTPDPSGAVTGGTVYRGNTYIDLRGYYIGTDFFTGILYRIKHDSIANTSLTTPQTTGGLITGISDFGETEDGELYAVSLFSGVYRVSASGAIGYTFTGNGYWDVATNWRNNVIPPSSLPAGAEIIVDPAGNGEAILNIPQTVLAGAKLYVRPGKNFKVNGNLVIQ